MPASHDDADALRGLAAVPLELPRGLELAWLGVSGYRMTYEGVSLFVDPYVSRVPLRSLLLRRRALPDPALLDRHARAAGDGVGVFLCPSPGSPRARRRPACSPPPARCPTRRCSTATRGRPATWRG